MNQSNAQISLAFRHHWPELQWCNRHRRLSSLVVRKLSEFRYPSRLLEFRVISSCLKYSIINTFLFSHTAFFIIPIPALRTDMDSGELISIYRTDTDNLLESPYSVLIFNVIRIYECPIWRRSTLLIFCNRCSLKKTICLQICSLSMDPRFLNDTAVWFFLTVNHPIYVPKHRRYRVVSEKCYSTYREKLFYRGDIVSRLATQNLDPL